MNEPESTNGLAIGWASRDVTPDRPVILRGQFHVRISQSVHDPVTVTALALQSGSEQCVMVSADRVGIPTPLLEGVRARATQAVPELKPESIFISATHTHTAPEVTEKWEDQGPGVMTPTEYAELFMELAADCVAEAWRSRQPGMVGWGCGQAVVGFNRRQARFDGSSQMYGDTNAPEFSHIEGYEDHSVDMLFTYDAAKQLTGMVVNLACPSQATESATFISADFWHEARCEIRRRHGADLFILPQCSPAGDQSPHLMLRKPAEARMLKLKGLLKEGGDLRMAERAEIGNRIANAVDEVLPLASLDMREEVPLRHVVSKLELPRRMVTEEDYVEAKQEVEKYTRRLESLSDRAVSDHDRSHCYSRRAWYGRVLERYEKRAEMTTYPMELHVLRLGDVVFATDSFELYLDFGTRMKARSAAPQTFLVQLAGRGTYLPSARSVSGRSYGSIPASSQVGPEGGQIIVEETVRIISELYADG